MEIEEFAVDITSFPRRPEGEDPARSKGVHLTDVIRSIMEISKMQRTASGSMWTQDSLELAGEVGFLWEEVLSQAMKERLPCRIGEVSKDGITMSPDGIEMEGDLAVLSEYKAIWASSNRAIEDDWYRMTQVKGYCAGLGLLVVRMYILYINGDWKGGGPQFKGKRITFSQREIDETWDMIVGHARRQGLVP